VIGFGGRVIGDGEPKYLNSPETPLFEKGRELYGLVQARDAIRIAGRVLVVEGYMDVVALAQFEVGYAVATLGTATTPVHVQKLLRLADELVFSFDGDAAGRKAAWRALEVSLPLALDHKPIRFLFLPQGDDPDTYIRQHGKEGFERLVRGAPTLSEFLLAELRGQADLASAEGRSGFLAAAKPHVQKVAAPALKLQLLKETAKLGGVTQEEVESLFDVRPAVTYRRPAPDRRTFTPPSSTEWKLLASVAAHPQIGADVICRCSTWTLPNPRRWKNWSAGAGMPSRASIPMLIEHSGTAARRAAGARAAWAKTNGDDDRPACLAAHPVEP
jgi:DNA primase